MPQESVELVRNSYEAFADGDLDRTFAILDPEIELDLSQRSLEPEIYHGHEGMREFLRVQRETWSDTRVEAEEYIGVGGNVVVVPMRFVRTGRVSDIHIVARAVWVWEFRNGLVIRITMYQSRADALEAVRP